LNQGKRLQKMVKRRRIWNVRNGIMNSQFSVMQEPPSTYACAAQRLCLRQQEKTPKEGDCIYRIQAGAFGRSSAALRFAEFKFASSVLPEFRVNNPYMYLYRHANITIKKGYPNYEVVIATDF
jgi:hypothetical protein